MDLYREWPVLVDREELFLWAKVLKNVCNILQFLFVVRIIASQNFLGLPISISSVFDDLTNISPRYGQSPLRHNRMNIR